MLKTITIPNFGSCNFPWEEVSLNKMLTAKWGLFIFTNLFVTAYIQKVKFKFLNLIDIVEKLYSMHMQI